MNIKISEIFKWNWNQKYQAEVSEVVPPCALRWPALFLLRVYAYEIAISLLVYVKQDALEQQRMDPSSKYLSLFGTGDIGFHFHNNQKEC